MNDENKDLIIDELLGLNTNNDVQSQIDVAQQRIISEMKKDEIIKDELDTITLDPKNDNFVAIIKDNVKPITPKTVISRYSENNSLLVLRKCCSFMKEHLLCIFMKKFLYLFSSTRL